MHTRSHANTEFSRVAFAMQKGIAVMRVSYDEAGAFACIALGAIMLTSLTLGFVMWRRRRRRNLKR